MEKVVIELPEVVKTSNTAEKRTAALEFHSGGKIITKQEADEIIQKWIEHIKTLVPRTKFDFQDKGKANWETYKKGTTNDMLRKHTAITGQNVKDYLLDEETNREDSKPEKEGYYYIYLFEVQWETEDQDGDTIAIAELNFRFSEGKAVAIVYQYDSVGEIWSDCPSWHCDSWKEGVETFLKAGREWFEKYGGEIDLPLPSETIVN